MPDYKQQYSNAIQCLSNPAVTVWTEGFGKYTVSSTLHFVRVGMIIERNEKKRHEEKHDSNSILKRQMGKSKRRKRYGRYKRY